MRTCRWLALLLSLGLALASPPRVHAELEVTIDYFYGALAPYGSWVEVEGYGPCWSPADVDADWAPYTEGQWTYTDAGWTWVGDEPFAGIVYHYGRWIMAGSLGWCWVPGYEWSPAWVSWRDSDEYIGWAPLPPEVVWEPQRGVGIWVDEVYGIGPGFYSFCHHRDFGERRLRSVILARTWNTTIIIQTLNITNITYNTECGVAYCGGPAYERASHFSSRPITALRLDRRSDFNLRESHRHDPLPGGQIVGQTLEVVAPVIRQGSGEHSQLPKGSKVVGRSQLNIGWLGKGASGDLDSVRRKLQSQVQGRTPTTAPVRPVTHEALQSIPQRPGIPKPVPPQVTVQQPSPAERVLHRERAEPTNNTPPALARIPSTVPFHPQPTNQPAFQNGLIQPAPPLASNESQRFQQQQSEAMARNLAEQQRSQELLDRQHAAILQRQREAAALQQDQQRARQQQVQWQPQQAPAAHVQQAQSQKQASPTTSPSPPRSQPQPPAEVHFHAQPKVQKPSPPTGSQHIGEPDERRKKK